MSSSNSPMSNGGIQEVLLQHLKDGGHVTLFLDYDGTLVPIAPTPPQAMPDPELLALLSNLAEIPSLRTVILSGRPLDALQHMLPIPGLIIGGLYGIEMRLDGQTVIRGELSDQNRARLVELRGRWAALIASREGFLLEDKGQALALHARWADDEQAAQVLDLAYETLAPLRESPSFRILNGHRYLEVAPETADKGSSVDWLLTHYPIPRDLPVGFGDDNKDEHAFAAIRRRGGYAVGVGHRYVLAQANELVDSPMVVRTRLRALLHSDNNLSQK